MPERPSATRTTCPRSRSIAVGSPKALYRLLYFRDGELAEQHSRHCSDDRDAVHAAWQAGEEYAIEIYQAERLVARVERQDEQIRIPTGKYGYAS